MNTTATTTVGGHRAGCDCGTCAVMPFERNNYFTGKLLLERDFTDEQEYVLAKLRHHNQRLHGSGVVCGLQLVQHPNPDCDSRFVRLTPGTAVDCCGHDVVVPHEEDIELAALPAIAEIRPNDEALHEIAICVGYHECGNEPVPVLYDECGCDDDRCLPNRILESYRIDAVVDPPASSTWKGPVATLLRDVPVPDARHVVGLPAGAFAVADGTSLHRVDAAGAVVATKDLGGMIHGLEVAAGGSLYVIRDDGSGKVAVSVHDASTLAQTHEKKIAGSTVPAVTAMSADGRLLVLQEGIGSLAILEKALETGSTAAAAKIDVDKGRGLLAAHPTLASAYVAAGPGSADANPERIDVVDLDTRTVAPLSDLGAGAQPRAVSVSLAGGAGTAGAAVLVALAGGRLRGLAEDGTSLGEATLAADGIDLAGSRWCWAVSGAGGRSRLQAVAVDRLGGTGAVGPTHDLAGDARAVALSADGRTVYVAHGGPDGADGRPTGGVQVLDVADEDCRDAWERLDDCPACEHPDCVVIGTIHGYRPGFKVLDAAPPGTTPPDPAADAAAGIARIDNHAGRTRLRSTAALERAIECMLDRGTGGGGRDGRDGRDGKDGVDGIDGVDGRNGTDGVDGRDGTDGVDGRNGTNGVDGRDGEGLEAGLTRIVMLSWEHRKEVILGMRPITDAQGERHDGVVIVFDRPVDVTLIDPVHVFTVDAPNPFQREVALEFGLRCRCPLAGDVVPVKVTGVSNGVVDSADITPGVQFSEAVAFVFEDKSMIRLVSQIEDLFNQLEERPTFGVHLHGEFVLDEEGRAVDAEFTRAELPSGDHPSGSKVGVQGGLFQSWFNVRNG